MKSIWNTCFLATLVMAAAAAPATAQGVLGRLDADIRQSNGQPPTTVAAVPRVYLGAIALDDAGRGVRITSIREGSPAQRAGLRTQDLVVGAGGRRIQLLKELMDELGSMNPGDGLALEIVRGARPMRIDVVLGSPSGAANADQRPGPPPPTGLGAGPTETIPPPPGDLAAPRIDGPALGPPAQSAAPNSPQAQIEELRRRVDQLERRVQELERALAEVRKK